MSASHDLTETHFGYASQFAIETHAHNASHHGNETQYRVANHKTLAKFIRDDVIFILGKKMDFKIFKQNVRNLKAIQKTRIQIGNGIYGTMIEELLINSPYLSQIIALRRDRNADKKKTAKLIKTALEELGITKEQLDVTYKKAKKEDPFYSDLHKMEHRGIEKYLEPDLEKMKIYTGYLKHIKGLGALTSAQLIAIVGDIERFKMPSSLWHYFGVGDPNANKLQHGKQATWNPKAKSLLLGTIGDNFLKQNSQYRIVYDQRTAKTKLTRPEWWHLNPDGTKATGKNMHPKHGYRDGIRVMMKRFLCEFFVASYKAKGLEPSADPWILTQPNHHRDPNIVEYKPNGL